MAYNAALPVKAGNGFLDFVNESAALQAL